MNGIFKVPFPINEPVYDYAPGSTERKKLKEIRAKTTKESTTRRVVYALSSEVG